MATKYPRPQPKQQGNRRRFQDKGNPNGHYRTTVMIQRDLSTYLEMRDGKIPPSRVVTDFLISVKNYCQEKLPKSRIHEVVTVSGTVAAEYPKFRAPDEVEDDTRWVLKQKYSKELDIYLLNVQTLDEHKLILMGVLERHISEEVKQKVCATEDGLKAYNERDPLPFMRAMFRQLMTEDSTDKMTNLNKASEQWEQLKMQDHESEANFWHRTTSILTALAHAYHRIGYTREDLEKVLPEEVQAVRYIMRLNDRYRQLKIYYQHRVREWPKTITAAHVQAAEFKTSTSDSKKLPAAHPEAAREPAYGFAYYKKDDSKEKTDKSQLICYKCEQPGHYAWQCKDKKGKNEPKDADVEKAVKQVRFEKKK